MRGSPTTRLADIKVLSMPLGGEADDLAAGGGYVWAYVRDTGKLVRVDQRTGKIRRFTLGGLRGHPVVAAASRDAVWLSDEHRTHPYLIRVDAASGQVVARPRVPRRAGPISGLTFAYGSLWILEPDASSGWRVLRLDPATNRVDKISADIAGTQFTGHMGLIWATDGRIWVTGSQDTIVSLDPGTMALRTTAIAGLSESLIFGGGYAWQLRNDRPSLAMVDPHTGWAIKTFVVPPPSVTGNDDIVAGTRLLWVFRGPHLSVLRRASGQPAASDRINPLAGALYSAALVAGRTLWYLAQTPAGTSLDRVDIAR
jgi:streptogramin lyase